MNRLQDNNPNPLQPFDTANYAPVGPAGYYNPFPPMRDFDPVYQGVPGAEPTQPVFSDKQAGLEGLWSRRDNAHTLWQIAVKGDFPPDVQKRRWEAFQEADNAWLVGQINPDLNPHAALEDRMDATNLGPARADADVMLRAVQDRQLRRRW